MISSRETGLDFLPSLVVLNRPFQTIHVKQRFQRTANAPESTVKGPRAVPDQQECCNKACYHVRAELYKVTSEDIQEVLASHRHFEECLDS